MTTRPDDWDQDEREAMAGLEDQLDAIRRRHAGDPPIEMLRAAHADVLPDEAQAVTRAHLDRDPWSRALVEGLEPGGDQPALDEMSEERLWGRINAGVRRAGASVPASPARGAGRRWVPWAYGGAALAASLVVAVVASRRQAPAPAPGVAPSPAVSASQPSAPTAPVALAFSKPDIKLSAAALTWRGLPTENPFLVNLKPAVDAYRDGDYPQADALFTELSSRYPRSVEVAFFQGITRMLREDYTGALGPLNAAVALDDPAFTEDAQWYLAVAEQRGGRAGDARARLDRLCRAGGLRAAEACTAARQLVAAAPGPRP